MIIFKYDYDINMEKKTLSKVFENNKRMEVFCKCALECNRHMGESSKFPKS